MPYQLPTKKDFWFLPLGGSNEIGMNLNLFGHDKQWLMVDCGITFHDRLGIEIVCPDPTFISQQKENLVGLVLTHAHEDHVGAVPYLWPHLKCPIYATPFTAEIVRKKIDEYPWRDEVKIIEVPLSGQIKVGKFEIEFITLTHSIAEPNALAITTPLGKIIHTGDWKIDPDPLVGETTNINRLKQLGDEGILAMLCDSTNVFTQGVSGSEKDVKEHLSHLIAQYPHHRVSVACFASNIARLQTVCQAAQQTKRKVCLLGRSLHRMIHTAMATGYMKGLPNFISDEEAANLPPHKVLLLCTGSQGEGRSALARIANNQHPIISFDEKDVVLFSSRVIPGNEKSIGFMQNKLARSGVTIATANDHEIHVSGHPARDELKEMYAWVRPHVLVPVHGEARHLIEQARYAQTLGIPKVVIPENGTLIQLTVQDPKIIDTIPVERWCLDGTQLVSMASSVLRERTKMSTQGTVFVSLVIDPFWQLMRPATVTLLGITEKQKEKEFITGDIHKRLLRALEKEYKDETVRLDALKNVVRQACFQRFGKKPVVEVHLAIVKE